MKLEPFLCLDGNEVSNGVRVATYLQNGIGNTAINAYPDQYCYALDEGFINPAVDPAPWFTSAVPASEEFLGFLASEIRPGPVFSRNVGTRSTGGGYLGPLTTKHRVIEVDGFMFSQSPRGMAYGERWLADVLQGGFCADCNGGTLDVLPACESTSATNPEVDASFKQFLEVGVVEGPEFTPALSNECVMQRVSFQLAAGQPYLYSPGVTIADAITLSTDTTPGTCATWSTDDWASEASTRIAIQNVSGADINGVDGHGKPAIITVRIYPYATLSDVVYDYPNPCTEFTIAHLAYEETLVVDSRYRQVLVYDVAKKRYVNGMDHIRFDGLFQWGDIASCTDAAICCEAYTNQEIEFTAQVFERAI